MHIHTHTQTRARTHAHAPLCPPRPTWIAHLVARCQPVPRVGSRSCHGRSARNLSWTTLAEDRPGLRTDCPSCLCGRPAKVRYRRLKSEKRTLEKWDKWDTDTEMWDTDTWGIGQRHFSSETRTLEEWDTDTWGVRYGRLRGRHVHQKSETMTNSEKRT